MFIYPEIFVLLIFSGALYDAVMYGVTASLSVIFKKVYPSLNETEIGLCFIPMGLGVLVGSLLSGRALDSQYRKTRDDESGKPELIRRSTSMPKRLRRAHHSRSRRRGCKFCRGLYSSALPVLSVMAGHSSQESLLRFPLSCNLSVRSLSLNCATRRCT